MCLLYFVIKFYYYNYSNITISTEARAASFQPRPSLCVKDIKRVHEKRMRTGSIYSMAKDPKHNCTLRRSLLRDKSIRWNR